MKEFLQDLSSISNNLKYFMEEDKEISFKKDFSDLVTNYDLLMEDKFLNTIENYFPYSSIVSEEKGVIKKDLNDVFYVDPIDGTTNFAHSIPLCATSVARVVDGRPVFAFISIPALNYEFYALKGEGSFLNSKKIKVSNNSEFRDSIFSTGFRNYSKSEHILRFLSDKVQGLRMFGSAAVAVTFVASAKTEVYWEYGLSSWDIAAAKLILEEAGGKVLNHKLEDFNITMENKMYDIVAYNGLLKLEEVF
jgi:myo-inositol-1(or 4)-monophosphatase